MARVLFLTNEYLIEPLGIGYLSAALKEAGHETALGQVARNGDHYDDMVAMTAIDATQADILAYSVTTGQHRLWAALNERMRFWLRAARSECTPISVFGGPHCTFFPDFLNEPGVDVIVRGEGEEAIVHIADAVDGKRTPLQNEWHPPDVNALPWPDRDLLYQYAHNRNNPIRSVLASRGCPFNCPYCYNQEYRRLYREHGDTRRTREPQDVVDEVLALVARFPTKLIYFQDDLFISPKRWFRRLTEAYASQVNVPYHCHVRADLLTEADVRQLRSTGCHGVTLAIENGDAELRAKALGRRMTDERIVWACAKIKEAGLRLRTENMIGIPGETWESAVKTVRLNQKCRADAPWCSLYQPYPGTRLGIAAEAAGLCKLDPDRVSPGFFEDLPLALPDRQRLINLQKFFALAVAHPRLWPLVSLLTKAPPNRVYQRFSDWYRRYRYRGLYAVKEREAESECR